MGEDLRQADRSAVPVFGPAGNSRADGAMALAPPRARAVMRGPRIAFGPLAGRVALVALILGSLVVVVFAAAGPPRLVWTSDQVFPSWEAGPLHDLVSGLHVNSTGIRVGYSVVLFGMLLAYGIALGSVRSLSMRTVATCIIGLHAILLLAPPLQLTDMFNYLGYARLGGLHGLNPYTHVIGQELHDPVYHFATWHNLHSPYGELFTAASYPLAWLSLPAAYWTLKVVTVLLSLAFVGLVCRCARQLGRDARFAALFVAANPLYILYAVGEFHNDFFMLVPSTAAISLLLARRDRPAGAALVVAVAVKFTAVLLLPFLLVAARSSRRGRDILLGAMVGAIPLLAMSIALFGVSIPNLSQQSMLLTDFSIPNLLGLAIGIGGGTPGLLWLANVTLVLTVALLLRRRGDWLSRAGWATLALIVSLAWLMPWYVIWLLPLAALGASLRLRQAAATLTVFLALTFAPVMSLFVGSIGFNPMGGSAGQASQALQNKLSSYH